MRDHLIERLRERWPHFDGQIVGIKYLRASQDASGRAISIASQDDEGNEFFDEHGIINGGTYYDNDLSASTYATQERPDYELALEDLRSGKAHLLWTFDSSRAQRNLAFYVRLRQICIDTGSLWAYGGRIYDMSDPSDRKSTARDAVEAEGASDTISTHVRRGMRKRARSGHHAGPIAYGYRRQYDPNTGKSLGQVIDAEQAVVIREMVERTLAGEPLTTIAKDLNKRGIPCPRERTWNATRIKVIMTEHAVPHEWDRWLARLDRESADLAKWIAGRVLDGESPKEIGRHLNRDSIPWIFPTVWCGSKVRRAVLSPVVAGIRIYQGKPMMVKVQGDDGVARMEPVETKWDAIVSAEDHAVLKARLGDPARRTVKDGDRIRNLWVGLVRCGVCEGRMVPRARKRRATKPDTKLRRDANMGRRLQCLKGHVVRPMDKLEAWLTEQALQLLERPDAARIFQVGAATVRSQVDLDEARVLRAELDGWRHDAIAGKVSRDSFSVIEAGLLERIERAEAKAQRVSLPPILVKLIGANARAVFAELGLSQQRTVLRAIMRPRVYRVKDKYVRELETATIDPGFLHVVPADRDLGMVTQ